MSFLPLPLNQAPYFEVDTHDPTTGASANADSTPTYTVYKAGNTAILTDQSFTLRTTGEYYATFTASVANGFAVNDYLIVRAKATVGGVLAKKSWMFWIIPAEASFGVPAANATYFGGTAGTFASGRPEVNTTHAAGTAWNSASINSSTLANGTLTNAKIADDAISAAKIANDAINSSKIATDAISASKIAAGALDADALATDAVAEIVAGILDEVVDGSTTMRQLLRGFASTLLGKASGLGTTTAIYRDLADTKARITATVDADGNRTAVTRDLT